MYLNVFINYFSEVIGLLQFMFLSIIADTEKTWLENFLIDGAKM